MWAQARFDLGLTSAEFWALTPRQFHALLDRRRAQLAHLEMVHAFTTAAVINNAPFRNTESVTPLRYMPNHPQYTEEGEGKAALTEEQQEQNAVYAAKVEQLAIELKRGSGELYDRVLRGEEI